MRALSFLGIQLNSACMCIFLPQDKLVKVCSLVNTMAHHRIVNDLQALNLLVYHLVYTSKVCPLGQAFLTNLSAVSSSKKEGQYRRLNLVARAGMVAGTSCLLVRHLGSTVSYSLTVDFHLFTDASGSWGCDAWYGSQWFQVLWPPYLVLNTPALRELYTIILACDVWGQHWSSGMDLCKST